MGHRCFVVAGIALGMLVAIQAAVACPLCGVAGQPLSDQLKISEVAILVRWVSGEAPKGAALGSTTYEILGSLGPRKLQFVKGRKLTLAGFQQRREGEVLLLLGTKVVDDPKDLDWSRPREFTQAAFDYLAQIPAATLPTAKRLEYFVPFLEHSDSLIAIDAFGEFAAAPYDEVVSLASKFSRDKLRTWVIEKPSPSRIGFYAMMLAHVGDADDAELLRRQVEAPAVAKEYPRGMDGLIVGYILLTKEPGLNRIDQRMLQPKASANDAYAAMQALRFLRQYEPTCVKPELLRASMRRLLAREDLAELAISDLARWHDWDSMGEIVKMFDAKVSRSSGLRKAVVSYLLAAIDAGKKQQRTQSLANLPSFALKAQEHLGTLRAREPKLVKEAEQFFIPNDAEP